MAQVAIRTDRLRSIAERQDTSAHALVVIAAAREIDNLRKENAEFRALLNRLTLFWASIEDMLMDPEARQTLQYLAEDAEAAIRKGE